MQDWLLWVENKHSVDIELGLERIRIVANYLDVDTVACPVITVAGTNGKGSTVAALEAIYSAAHYRTGVFTSPVLLKHNEQVRIQNRMATDAEFCDAFECIAAASKALSISLTPFEVHTLAALCIFKTYPLDILILEVGLGGRLDAVNLIDADVAVVTSIGIDHVEWLGETRDAIGFEKAGIFRSAKPAVCGDPMPPRRLIEHAIQLGTPLLCQGKDFYFVEHDVTWDWHSPAQDYVGLPKNNLLLQNMTTALMAITLLQHALPVDVDAIKKGLSTIQLRGRREIIAGPVMEILDVAHNPDAVRALNDFLPTLPPAPRTLAVFSMLADKDVSACLVLLRDAVDVWYTAPLATKRAADQAMLQAAFQKTNITSVTFCPSIQDAYREAQTHARPGDRIIVFGSFHTVAAVMK